MLSVKKETRTDTIFLLFFVFFATDLGLRLKDQGSDSCQSVPDPVFKAGKKVRLATAHRRRDYIQGKDGRVAKFMTRYDGPYVIFKAFWLH